MATKTFKSSINTKTLGNPRNLLGKHDMKEGDIRLLGTIIGSADGVVRRSNPKEPDNREMDYYGLSGTFEAVPADTSAIVTRGNNLFAPDVIHDEIVAKLKSAGQGGVVSFAYEAYVRAGGTSGFTWEYKFLGEGKPEEDDVLSEMRKLLERQKVAALEPPKAQKKGK